MSYSNPGFDYWEHPPRPAPGYLSSRVQLIFGAIEAELVRQGADESSHPYVCFFPDSKIELEGVFRVTKIAEAIDKALSQVEEGKSDTEEG